jgi:hypothetical protein
MSKRASKHIIAGRATDGGNIVINTNTQQYLWSYESIQHQVKWLEERDGVDYNYMIADTLIDLEYLKSRIVTRVFV